MAIYLKKNAIRDRWFSLHGIIPVGEILKLVDIDNKDSSARYPANITVKRSKTTGDNREYLMSLNCLDYLGSTG